MSRSGINAELLRWLETKQIKHEIKIEFEDSFNELSKNFLNAVTDARRLTSAEDLAEIILKKNGLDELIRIRKEVRKLELKRAISYSKQTDHSAHSLYVYLLGLYIYKCSPVMMSTLGDDFHRFLFPWVYAGLLHDVGYIFSEPISALPSSRGLLERFFELWRIEELAKPTTPYDDNDFKEFISFVQKLKSQANWQDPCYSRCDYPIDILDELRKIPWIERFELGLDTDAFRLFQQCVSENSIPTYMLENYAYKVAISGYDEKSNPEIDHAIASSLFLLQYCSYWYWLSVESQKVKDKSWCYKYICEERLDFSKNNLPNKIIPALYSVACHNVLPSRHEGKYILPIRLEADPLTYLLVLCDILQIWDRFPAGTKYLDDLDSFSEFALISEEVNLSCSNNLIVFEIKSNSTKFKEDLINNLNQRLVDWKTIIEIKFTN